MAGQARWLLGAFAIAMVVCAASHAEIMGRDERNDASSYLTPEQQLDYSNIGRVECPVPDGTIVATGWIIGSFDTIVTAAHAFVSSKNEKIDPSTCYFVMYDYDGIKIDNIKLRYAVSRYDEPGQFNDKSNDLAVAKLSREPRQEISIRSPNIATAGHLDKNPIILVAFHGDVPNKTKFRVTHGILYKMPVNKYVVERGITHVSNYSRLFKASYDSGHGASGGMVIDVKTGAIIGIHLSSSTADSAGKFNENYHFNYGVYFDKRFVAQIKAVAASK